ncbi:hypothetical protein MRX96_024087 [Rhipicephalus microplus]
MRPVEHAPSMPRFCLKREPGVSRLMMAGGSSEPARGFCILCTAMVIAIAAAIATFYATTSSQQYTEGSTAYTFPKTPGTQLVFVPNDTAAEVDDRAKAEKGSEDTTSIHGETTSMQST